MSLRAMLWALDEAPCESSAERLILVYLADYADDAGRGVFPALQTVADRAGMSRSTVKRHVQGMASRGLLAPGDDRLVSHYRPDRRPKVWDLSLGLSTRLTGGQNDPSLGNGGSKLAERGVKNAERGVTHDPQTVNIDPLETNAIFPENNNGRGAPDGATPPDPVAEARAAYSRPKAGPLPIESYGACSSVHCPRCGAEAGEPCTRFGVQAVLPCGERMAASRKEET